MLDNFCEEVYPCQRVKGSLGSLGEWYMCTKEGL